MSRLFNNINSLISSHPSGTGIAFKEDGLWDSLAELNSREWIMKLAIMLYGTRVAPRFGYSQGALVVEVSNRQEIRRKTMEVGKHYPEQIPEILGKEGVELVISGGMNHPFQNLFRLRGIEVIWGIIGEAEDVLTAFKSGQLTPGMGRGPEGRKRRQRQKGFRGRGQNRNIRESRRFMDSAD